jgi:hypothetical protein
MKEIQSINTIYNNDVSVLIPDEDNEHIYEIVHFVPKNKSGEWLVEIFYDSSTPDDPKYSIINGTITFINSKNPDEKIEYEFSKESFVEHSKTHDEMILELNKGDGTINLNILYDDNKNAIVNKIDITTSTNKITDNSDFVDYNSLEIDSIEGYLNIEDSLKAIKEHMEDCGIGITFTTDYYHNNYSDFNPWNT